jgi:hypothetical protein
MRVGSEKLKRPLTTASASIQARITGDRNLAGAPSPSSGAALPGDWGAKKARFLSV